MKEKMITEDYVSFETAKLLKEKGFDEKCSSVWRFTSNSPKGNGKWILYGYNMTDEYSIWNPTLQMAMKWLLKKHNIFICLLFLEESNGFGYTIENIITKKYIATSKNSPYKKPEEACETAIKYCLENLI